MLLVLFGPPGVGKSFIGNALAAEHGFHFYDADTDLTADMINAIQQEQVFTTEMRHHYFNIVTRQIQKLKASHEKVVCAQALAKEINRQQILDFFPEAKFIYVSTNIDNVNERLKIRDNWVSIEYANKIRKIFETPQIKHEVLDNNRDKRHVQRQLERLFVEEVFSL